MKLNEATEKAYMINRQGKVFKMVQHVYGSKDSIEETLAAAEWLYQITSDKIIKQSIINLIYSWGYSLNKFSDNDIINSILNEINNRPYKFLSAEFIQNISNELENADYENVNVLNDYITDYINEQFLRARYGGMYNSSYSSSRNMIFRVSSHGFNWFNIIFNFVYTNKHLIDTVTIVRDEEATGSDDIYTYRGKKLWEIPLDEFIMFPGNPLIEKFS